MPFPARAEYETLVYSLLDAHPDQISRSALVLYSVSPQAAIVEGDVIFHSRLRLRVVEVLDFKAGRIRKYNYEIWRGGEKIRWYDPQPHPENPDLASTFPHHRHELPDIKDNRKPAPGISFDAPNLPTLIADCIELGEALKASSQPEGDS